MKRRARKIAFKLFVFLLAGAIINVAVAWGCTLRWLSLSFDTSGNLEASSPDAQWLAELSWPVPDPATFIAHVGTSTFGWFEDQYTVSFKPYEDAATATLWRTRSGWPFLSVEGFSQSGNNKTLADLQVGLVYVDGDLIGRPNDGWHFPASPIFPGFAINTIFYAAVVWALFAVPGAIRRRVRRKRGECAACGYSLRGAPDTVKCPECGATA